MGANVSLPDLDDLARDAQFVGLRAAMFPPIPPPVVPIDSPEITRLLNRMSLLSRVQNYLPYGSQIWQDVMKARGLDPRPRSNR